MKIKNVNLNVIVITQSKT